jgi:hypothetical protein
MGRVIIQCPRTGKWVPTGFEMNQHGFEVARERLKENPLECPECGETHYWDMTEAFLEEETPSGP